MATNLAEALSSLYQRVGAAWHEHRHDLFDGACGYSIIGSEPVAHPKLMILGENPGFGQYDRGGPPHIQEGPPKGSYFEGETWPLKQRLLELFQKAGLEEAAREAVFANFLFFKSGSLANPDDDLSWHKVDRSVRAKLEGLCCDELKHLVNFLDPQVIIILGMRAFDRYARGEVVCAKATDQRRRLVCKGTLWGKPAIGLMHPTGARWSDSDRLSAARKVAEIIRDGRAAQGWCRQ